MHMETEPTESRRGIGSPGARVSGTCLLANMGAGNYNRIYWGSHMDS